MAVSPKDIERHSEERVPSPAGYSETSRLEPLPHRQADALRIGGAFPRILASRHPRLGQNSMTEATSLHHHPNHPRVTPRSGSKTRRPRTPPRTRKSSAAQRSYLSHTKHQSSSLHATNDVLASVPVPHVKLPDKLTFQHTKEPPAHPTTLRRMRRLIPASLLFTPEGMRLRSHSSNDRGRCMTERRRRRATLHVGWRIPSEEGAQAASREG